MYHEEYEDNVDQVLSEIDQSEKQAYEEKKSTDNLWNTVVNRIEEANLFTLLIKQPVFTSNSASPHILDAVNKKIKKFATDELQRLLGLSKPEETKQLPVKLPFDNEEIQVLKILSAKMLKRDIRTAIQTDKTPEIKPIVIEEQQEQEIEPEPEFHPQLSIEQPKPVTKVSAPIVAKKPAPVVTKKPAPATSPVQPSKQVKAKPGPKSKKNPQNREVIKYKDGETIEDKENRLRSMAPIRPDNHPRMATADQILLSGAAQVTFQDSTNTGNTGSTTPLSGLNNTQSGIMSLLTNNLSPLAVVD